MFVLHTVMKRCENSLPVLTYTANMWCTLKLGENIVTQILQTKLTQIMVRIPEPL